MELEQLLEINPKLASMAKFMTAHPEIPVRFWENGTVDMMIGERASLVGFIGKFTCPSCGGPTSGPVLDGSENVRGTFRECADCGIRYFIHNKVKFGGTT